MRPSLERAGSPITREDKPRSRVAGVFRQGDLNFVSATHAAERCPCSNEILSQDYSTKFRRTTVNMKRLHQRINDARKRPARGRALSFRTAMVLPARGLMPAARTSTP